MLSDALMVAAALGETFDALGVTWLVGGSVASSLLGMPRTTQDLDLVAGLYQTHVSSLEWALEGSFHLSAEAIREAIRRRASFNLIHVETMFKVDVFLPRADALSKAELKRRCFLDIRPGLRLPVASSEDIILQKLDWYRKGNLTSERQWRDVQGVIQVGPMKLDLVYLREVAAEAGLTDLLEAALAGRPRP